MIGKLVVKPPGSFKNNVCIIFHADRIVLALMDLDGDSGLVLIYITQFFEKFSKVIPTVERGCIPFLSSDFRKRFCRNCRIKLGE